MILTILAVAALAGTPQANEPRAEDQTTRELFAEEFISARPANRPTPPKPAAHYRLSSASTPVHSDTVSQLGMTLWLLRPARSVDSGVRILVHENGEDSEWIPERLPANTPLREGDRVRLSFESPQQGYLYVIDRELYTGGQLGDPYLIFPTTRLRGGDNSVVAGRVVEIPGQEDRPNFLTMHKSRKDQIGEVLSVIVSPEQLAEVKPGSKPMRLNHELVNWEKEWGGRTETFELASGSRKPWTKAEQQAGANETRLLTQDDPGPQTIYQVVNRKGHPLLITVHLRCAQ